MSTITSSVTWVLILTAVGGALQALQPVVSGPIAGVITAILAVVGVVLHSNQIKTGKV